MAHLFISYSRKDDNFAQHLTDELSKLNRDVWIDWKSIPGGSRFLAVIYDAIEHADAFLFIVSRHSLTSEYCNLELAHARQYHKRIFPLVLERMEGDAEKIVKGTWVDTEWEATAKENYAELKTIDYLFFDNPAAFSESFQALLQALETDLPHREKHTALLAQAIAWERHSRENSFLLKGQQLRDAETWLTAADAGHKKPEPDPLHRQYIETSRQAEEAARREALAAEERMRVQQKRTRQFRTASWILGGIGFLALIATLIFANEKNLADTAMSIARITVTAISAQSLYNEGVAQYNSGSYQDARDRLLNAIAITEAVQDAAWYEDLAKACLQIQQFDCAEQYFQKTIDVNPSRTTAYVGLAIVQREIGSFDEALKTLDKAVAVYRQNGEKNDPLGPIADYSITRVRGSIAFARHDYPATIAILDSYAGQKSYPAFQKEVLYYLAVSYEQQGSPVVVCRYWNQYKNVPKSFPPPYREEERDQDAQARMAHLKCPVE